jgi:hypothetical protein
VFFSGINGISFQRFSHYSVGDKRFLEKNEKSGLDGLSERAP